MRVGEMRCRQSEKNPIRLHSVLALSPGPTQNRLGKQSGHTCKNSRMCCISSLHLEQRNHVRPLPITTFLTREDSRLIPRPFKNGYEASGLFTRKVCKCDQAPFPIFGGSFSPGIHSSLRQRFWQYYSDKFTMPAVTHAADRSFNHLANKQLQSLQPFHSGGSHPALRQSDWESLSPRVE